MKITRYPDRNIIINNREFLYFGGTSYLGITTNKGFYHQLIKSMQQWGVFYGSSRKSNIQLQIYDDFEQYLAKQIGSKKTIAVSSGTLAGKLVIEELSKTNPSFYHYPKSHPAIKHHTSKALFVDGNLHPKLLNHIEEEIVITADSILGLEVTPTDFSFLNKISNTKKVTLLIDESHAIGVLGNTKMGVFSSISDEKIDRKIAIASLGKGLGIPGGMIASDASFIEKITHNPFFIAAASANPAYLDAYIKSEEIYRQQQEKLQRNIDFIYQSLVNYPQLMISKNYPVLYSFQSDLYKKLYQKNIIITHFKYPTYTKKMNRIVITANHTQKDLESLIKALHHL